MRIALTKMKQAMLMLGVALAPSLGFGSPVLHAHVVNFGTYGSGNVFVTLDASIQQTNCVGPFIEVAAGDTAKQVLAVATAAFTTGATVQVLADGCLNSATTITARGFFGFD